MKPDELRRAKQLFLAASELPEPQRQAWLDEQDATDAVRALVDRQLACLDDAPDELPQPAHKLQGELEPATIGPYRVLERLGEGGMGVVYRAEQTEPVRRIVAVKRIKPGMDSRAVLGRFENERQVLARMDHPNIARVLDAGTDQVGRPYFAMELVDGPSIVDYCDTAQLTTEDRLALFLDVCRGVEHAHQRGILHRDLKPSNLLVAEVDGRPVPKIIDFGVAKATAQRLTEQTLHTQLGLLVGTPEYMSPEQADPDVRDLDTRSDVYALGVLLYQLLSGELPFDPRELRAAGFAGILRVLREQEPPRPSTRLSTVAGTAGTEHARHRRLDPHRLALRLRGDLDWITMRALQKRPEDRYASAGALAADLERHLRDEPVSAGPPTLRYRLTKYVRRHRTQVAVLGAVGLSLVLGTVVSINFALEAREQTRVAGAALREADANAREARAQRDQARQVTDFLTGALGFFDPDVAQDPDVTVSSFLDRVAASASKQLAGQPQTEAAVLAAIGGACWTRGELQAARRHLDRARLLAEADPGATPLQLHAIYWPCGWVHWQTGSQILWMIWPCAVENARRAIAQAMPEADRAMRELRAWSENDLDHRHFLLEDPVAAAQEIVATASAVLPRGDPHWLPLADFLTACVEMAALHGKDVAVTDRLFATALRVYTELARLPASHTRLALARESVLYAYHGAGEYRRGREVAEEALRGLQDALPAEHWYRAVFRARIASSRFELGDRGEELTADLLANVAMLDRTLGCSSEVTLVPMVQLVQLLSDAGREGEAEPWRRRIATGVARNGVQRFEYLTAALGPARRDLQRELRAIPDAYERLSAGEKAPWPVFESALAACDGPLRDEPMIRGAVLGWLDTWAEAYVVAGQAADGRSILRAVGEATLAMRLANGWQSPAESLYNIAVLLQDHAEKQPLFEQVLDQTRANGGGDYGIGASMNAYGRNLCQMGRHRQGLEALHEGYRLALRAGVTHRNVRALFNQLRFMHAEVGSSRELVPLARERMQELLRGGAPAAQLNICSWTLVQHPGLDRGTYELARRGAREATDLQRRSWNFRNTLGAAEYRCGDLPAAIREIEESRRLRQAQDQPEAPEDLLFLAMAHAGLGEHAEAEKLLDRARSQLMAPGNDVTGVRAQLLEEAQHTVGAASATSRGR